MKKLFLTIIFVTMGTSAFAGGYSDWAVPTNVELVNDGVLIYGAFGDPNNCGQANSIYVRESDSRFESVLSMALAALMGQREMRLYSNTCTSVGFHWAGNVINLNNTGQAVYIR